MAVRKRDRALAALVLIDASLKIGAWVFFRHRASLSSAAGPIRLGYVENSSGFGYDQTRLLGRYGVATNDAFVACTLAVFLIFALVIFLWHKVEAGAWIKTAAAAAVYFAAAMVALSLHDSMSLSLSPFLRGILRALGPLAVALVLYSTVSKPYYAALSLLFLAGTLGNCASIALPPFAVIDYFGLYRPSIHTYVYANAADAYLLAAMLMIAFIPLYLIVLRIVYLRRRSRA
jgi:lipoprotein signal peptidase